MNIAKFSVKNSLLVNLLSLLVILAGLYTLFIYKIEREAFPNVSFDMVVVQAVYPGSTAEEVEKLITVPLETEIKGIDGIDKYYSTSGDSVSTITIEIDEDYDDKDTVVDDIQRAVDRVNDLPEEADDPIVTEITSKEIPVVEIALGGDLEETVLHDYSEQLEDLLENIDGVSKINKGGWRDPEVWVEVDPNKLDEYHLSLEEVITALKEKNVSIPGGKIRADEEYNIRTTGEFFTKEEIENVIIRATDIGNWLRVKDIGTVRFTFEDENTIYKCGGTRAISLVIIKQSSGDAITIVDQAKEIVNAFKKTADPRLTVSYVDDMSYYIRRRLGALRSTGIVGLIIVMILLSVFLNKRVALLTALGIPIAFFVTVSVMAIMGLSVNLITMFGLIIVLGMLVDDGIIVAENCSRHMEQGMDPPQAAIIGTSEVIRPVTATIITTIAGFAPLLFISGMVGKFIWGIPAVVIIALIASLFEALVILPSHFADFVKKPKEKITEKETLFRTTDSRCFSAIQNFYMNLIRSALTNRYKVLGSLLILLAVTFFAAKQMPFILFGSQEIEQFYIKAEAPIGTNLYTMEKLLKPIEDIVSRLPDNELDVFVTQVGSSRLSWMHDRYGKDGSHLGQVVVYVEPPKHRNRSVIKIIESLRSEVETLPGFTKIYFEQEKEGPPVGKPIAVEVRGDDLDVLDTIATKITVFLQTLKGVSDSTSDYEIGQKEIHVVVNEDQAALAELSVNDIAWSVRAAFEGGVATSIKQTKAEDEIDVMVRFPESFRNKKTAFAHIYIPNKKGNLIPLSRVAHLEEIDAVNAIRHLDGKRIITVRAEVDNKKMTSMKANKILEKQFASLTEKYPGYRISFAGEQEENVRLVGDFKRAFAWAGLMVFMILAAMFNSLIQPFIILMAIPFGLIGVVWAFLAHGEPIGFFMFMGVVGLNGIVVNDAIVLVEFINNLRKQGHDRRASLIEAGRLRLRPVLLTTITTVGGLLPTAYGFFGGDPFLKPMALAICWGLVFATGLTLIVIPCIYAFIDDVSLFFRHRPTVKQNGNES